MNASSLQCYKGSGRITFPGVIYITTANCGPPPLALPCGPARNRVPIMTIATETKSAVTESRLGGRLLILLVLVMLAGLPLAVWLDISNLSQDLLRRQAEDLSSLITSIRGYYATNVVG